MKTFRSKIGWEIWAPVGLLLLTIGYVSFLANIWPSLVVVAIVAVLIFILVTNISYTITTDNKLIIRGWISSYNEIDIHSIRKIEKSSNPVSSPAASYFGRMEVYYNNGQSVVISPNDKKAFVDNLLRINQNITVKEVF